MVYQDEIADCGFACIAMLCSYFNKNISVTSIKNSWQNSLRGLDVFQLTNILDSLSFNSNALRVEINELIGIKYPLILHWRLSHFVVLEKLTKKNAYIIDPSCGRRKISLNDFSRNFSGIAIEAFPSDTFVQEKEPKARGIFSFLKNWEGITKIYIVALFLSIVEQSFVILLPLLLKFITDQVINTGSVYLLVSTILIVLLVSLLSLAISFYRGNFLLEFSSMYFYKYSSSVTKRLFNLPLSFFNKNNPSAIVDKLASLSNLRTVVTENFVLSVIEFISFCVILIVLGIISPYLLIVSCLILFLQFGIRLATVRKFKSLSLQSVESWSNWRNSLDESIRCMAQFRIAGKHERRNSYVDRKLSNAIHLTSNEEKYRLIVFSINSFLLNFHLLALILCGSLLLMKNLLSLGSLFASIALANVLISKFNSFLINFFTIFESNIYIDRISSILKEDKATKLDITDVPDRDVVIEIENVSFAYDKGNNDVVKNLSLRVARGDCIGLYGKSGSGKSTIVKLLVGFQVPRDGSIKINGNRVSDSMLNICDLDLYALMQGDKLLTGSIADNISFFDESPDRDRIVECAKQALIYEDIFQMPMKFESLVGNDGGGLSGGQIQRVLIARALYSQKSILILDEATANLDMETEKKILSNLVSLNKTLVIITHRVETLKIMDFIYKFDSGALCEATL